MTDLRSQKIPNLLTFPALAAFLAFHGLAPADAGGQGLGFALGGAAVGFGLLVGPHALGVLGAGDVKFMAAAGAALGPGAALWAVLLGSVAGGLYAASVLAFRQDVLRRVLTGLWQGALVAAAGGGYAAPAPDGRLPRLCYGLALGLGCLAAMACRRAGLNLWGLA